MPADVAGDLAATGRMAHQHNVAEVERLGQRRQIVGIGVHLVAGPRLAGPAMASAVVPDGAVAAGCNEHHLRLPGIGAERPAMAEQHGLPLAPALVVDLRSVGCGDRAHVMTSLRDVDRAGPGGADGAAQDAPGGAAPERPGPGAGGNPAGSALVTRTAPSRQGDAGPADSQANERDRSRHLNHTMV